MSKLCVGGIEGQSVDVLAAALVREAQAATPQVPTSGYFARPLCVEELRDLCARVLVILSGLPVAPAGRNEAPESTGALTDRLLVERPSEDEIARYYWPKEMGEPAAWLRAAISDAFDCGISFAVRRDAEQGR